MFNIAATAVLLPFANVLEKLAILTIPDSPEKESFALLDERLLNTPAVAVERARSATADMAELARVGVVQAMSLTHQWNDELAQKVRDEESTVDRYEDALGTYLVKLSGRELSHADSQSVNTLLHTISDFERISDHSVNLLESADGFEKKLFPGRKFIFQIYMISLMIPGQVTMIPLFVIMKNVGLLNTRTALVITMIGAFSVFLVKQFMNGIPDELIESAQVDGCPEYRIFIQIVMPLLKPVVITLIVFTFISAWNDFLWPLIAATETEKYTLTVALSVLKTQYSVNYGLIMAGSLITFIFPFILYIFLQKQFVQGIALGGVKG